jgi:glycosyltransferase involved in cell wall biosynthesis
VIRVAHLIPFMSVGGVEQMVLQLCRYLDRAEFECSVAAPEGGVMLEEMRAGGIRVATGPASFAAVARDADILNLHWVGYDPQLFSLVQRLGKPLVTTLNYNAVLPDLPALTICVSDYTHQRQANPARCVVIPNGVDLSRFAARSNPTRDKIVLTRICRPEKCALYFWTAMKRLLHRFPQAELRIVGEVGKARSDSDRIQFLGVRRDIPEILADTDIFVYTPYREIGGHDLVVMEASAACVPCVLSDVCAVRDSIVEGKNGFLTPFGDVDAVVDRVSRLVRDRRLRTQMSRASVEIARERFDMTDVARRYAVVYRTVLDACGSRQGSRPAAELGRAQRAVFAH